MPVRDIRFTQKNGSWFDVSIMSKTIRFTTLGYASFYDVTIANKTAIVFTRSDGTTFDIKLPPTPLIPIDIYPKQIETSALWDSLSSTITTLHAYNGTQPYTWSLVRVLFLDNGNAWILGDQLHVEVSARYPGVPTILAWLGSVDVRVTDSTGWTADQTINLYAKGYGVAD
jgi:hypothetical protein